QLNADGTTIAVITHDRDIAAALPRRVELRDGRIVTDTGRPPAGAGVPPAGTSRPSAGTGSS
ncbi:hypothetical protein AB0C31_46125, partial [Actinoplanes philippinensis]